VPVPPEPVDRDSRGILDPWLLRRRMRLTRYPPTPALDGLVDRFWAVSWALPAGARHRQEVLTHPGANLSVGVPDGHDEAAGVEARLNGVARGLTTRVLVGRGWAVAAMTTPGGLGALVGAPAAEFTDRVVPLGSATGLDEPALVREVVAAPDEPGRVRVLAEALQRAVDPERVAGAREVAAIARLAETDRALRRLADLCTAAGVAERSLQRLFHRFAGVSPTWVLRRYRLLDAAEAVRDGRPVSWAALAADLGYADQAHLVRDFHASTGQTPDAYARAQDHRAGPGTAGSGTAGPG
jgi:AraC-like DNA-binding protein